MKLYIVARVGTIHMRETIIKERQTTTKKGVKIILHKTDTIKEKYDQDVWFS